MLKLKNLLNEVEREVVNENELLIAEKFISDGPKYFIGVGAMVVFNAFNVICVYGISNINGKIFFETVSVNSKTITFQNNNIKTILNTAYYNQINRKEFLKHYFITKQEIEKKISAEMRAVITEKIDK